MTAEEIHSSWSALFASDLGKRFRATQQFLDEGNQFNISVWEACWGAANGWSMLIGPSPGGTKDGSEGSSDGTAKRKKNRGAFRIGLDAGRVHFPDEKRTNRSTNWNRLATAAAKGNAEYGQALTTIANLDFLNSAREKDIDPARLKDGCAKVFDVMTVSRPRIVMPLTNTVYWTMSAFLNERSLVSKTTRNPNDEPRPLVWFSIPGAGFDSVMLKAPKHPSWVPSKKSLEALIEFTRTST